MNKSERSNALSEACRRRLERADEVYGLRRVLAALNLAEGTYWRARAGGPVYRGTEIQINEGLAKLEREAP
jgi:precorrin-6B methylase 1